MIPPEAGSMSAFVDDVMQVMSGNRCFYSFKLAVLSIKSINLLNFDL